MSKYRPPIDDDEVPQRHLEPCAPVGNNEHQVSTLWTAVCVTALVMFGLTSIAWYSHAENVEARVREMTDSRDYYFAQFGKANEKLHAWEAFRPKYEKFQADYAAYVEAQGCKCGCQSSPCSCGGCCR